MIEITPLIILGSAREEGETKSAVDFVFDKTSHKRINLLKYNISTYNYASSYGEEDNFSEIAQEIVNHNTILFATPVYWYAMSGLMKNLFDRFTDLVTFEKKTGRKLKGKHVFLLAVGSDKELPEGFEIPFKNTAEYLDMDYKGSIYFSSELKDTNKEREEKKQKFIYLLSTSLNRIQ